MTLGGKEYQFKDFKTLGMRLVATQYHDMYSDAVKKLYEREKDKEHIPGYEELSELQVAVDLSFNMFLAEATVTESHRYRRNKYQPVKYFELDSEEVTAFVQGFFSGLTDSMPKPSE